MFRYNLLPTLWWWQAQLERVRLLVLGPRRLKNWYDVRTDLPLVLGNTLVYWADHMNAYPPDYTEGEWQASLRDHGTALIEFSKDDEDLEKTWEAQKALRWAADNLLSLWD